MEYCTEQANYHNHDSYCGYNYSVPLPPSVYAVEKSVAN